MSVKLYHFPISAPSRGALLAARVLKVPVDIEVVDLFKKEQLSEGFLKINPQHCIPTLDDDGFIMWESRAIACYLADKFGKDDTFYPKDLKKRAVVNQRLYFDSSSLYVKIRAICHPIIFGLKSKIDNNLKDDLNTTLGFLNIFLDSSKYVAGDNVTIADTAIYASISNLVEIDWDLSSFSNIKRWLKQCESLSGYAENNEGAKAFGEVVKKNLK